jgi:hypothetical protein
MIKRGNKKGQFYLLAAIVLVAVIIGFATVTNYYKKQVQVKVYDLGDELGIEGNNVIEYGIIQGISQIEDFNEKFGKYADGNFYFVYGNSKALTIATMQDVILGNVQVLISGWQVPTVNIEEKAYTKIIESSNEAIGDYIEIIAEGTTYKFTLKPGENFYFVISQDVGGEKHIAIS